MSGDCCLCLFVARLGGIELGKGDNLFSYQLLFSIVVQKGIIQFGLALVDVETCNLDIRHGSFQSGFNIIVFQTGNDFILFHPAAFLHC